MLNISPIFKNRFIKSSGIVLIGSLTANVLNYVFNLVMGRMLSPAEYGEAAALITLVMIVVVPSTTLTTLLAKYTAEYQAKNEQTLISRLFKFTTRYALLIGLGLLLVFWFLTPAVSSFLKAEKLPLIIFGLLLPITLISGASRGALQGLQKFVPFSLMSVIETCLKLGLSIVFVALGFSVTGVIMALVLGSIVSYFYSLFNLKPHLNKDKLAEQINSRFPSMSKDTRSYLLVIFLATLFLAMFSNIDVILAKHYLPDFDAGQYAALAVIGRMITYGSTAMVTVMFPMASASHVNGDGKGTKLLTLTLGLIAAISIVILILFLALPELIVTILFGSKYLMVAPYLGLFGLVMLCVALSRALVNYFMAVHNNRFIYPFGILAVVQIVLIVLFHQNILQIIYSLLASSVLLLVSLAIIYLTQAKKSKLVHYVQDL